MPTSTAILFAVTCLWDRSGTSAMLNIPAAWAGRASSLRIERDVGDKGLG